jgi:hypothetical protein
VRAGEGLVDAARPPGTNATRFQATRFQGILDHGARLAPGTYRMTVSARDARRLHTVFELV